MILSEAWNRHWQSKIENRKSRQVAMGATMQPFDEE